MLSEFEDYKKEVGVSTDYSGYLKRNIRVSVDNER